MANEKRLIDAYKLEDLVRNNSARYHHADDVIAAIAGQPTVDAVVLPCKIGDDVYNIPSKVNFDLNVLANHKENNRVHHQRVAEIVFNQNGWYMRGSLDKEYGTDRILVDRFYNETWFLTKEEAESALAKMDGDGDGS